MGQQQQRDTRIHRSALLIVRSRGQRRKGQSRLSHAWAEERPGRMRHGRRERAQHGWASVPPTASQSIAASNVDAAWGSGHHQETHMWGAKGLPSPHATNCHAEACGPRRRRTTCACHTRDQTPTHHRSRDEESKVPIPLFHTTIPYHSKKNPKTTIYQSYTGK